MCAHAGNNGGFLPRYLCQVESLCIAQSQILTELGTRQFVLFATSESVKSFNAIATETTQHFRL